MDKRESLRKISLGKLSVVVHHCLAASQTGRNIAGDGFDAHTPAGALEVLGAVVGVKSPATLVKRANSLLAFLRWCAKTNVTDENPFHERIIWQYLSFLKESGAPPTKGASAMSAFRFAFYVLGFDSLKVAVESRRLVGISDIMLANDV